MSATVKSKLAYVAVKFKHVVLAKINKIFVTVSLGISWLLSTYVDLWFSIKFFLLVTTIDTITSIHKNAKAKNLKFNPFKKYFYFQIKSDLLRVWAKKVFYEYFIMIIIAFAFDTWILKNQFYWDLGIIKLRLPIAVIWYFSAVETWSVFENLEQSGHKNYLKILLKLVEEFIPEKFKKIVKKAEKSINQKSKKDE